tara:strand:- start:212 stop:601 length:390 start_codon:yes stop_codon:yes gene_type:complete
MISLQELLNEEIQIEEYTVENYDDIKEFCEFMKEYKSDINEAEYQGRTVKLGKPMQGDTKKFKVYVKNPKGNVVKVNFGHGGSSAKKSGEKTMSIRKNNPDARKAFRARHNCDSPGPRHKARYWSCRKW